MFKEIIRSSNDRKLVKILTLDYNELSNLINSQRRAALSKYAFCSLSEDPTNVLMWSHYADNHSGIVVGFDIPEEKEIHNLQKVKYQNKLNDINLEPYANFLINSEENKEAMYDFMSDYSLKSEHWAYEKEWRIWRNKPGYYQYKKEQVKEIYFGLNTSLETKSIIIRILNWLPEDFNFNEVELVKNPLGLK